MRRFGYAIIICFACLVMFTGEASAQRGTDWMTSDGDAQRSAWVRADAKISKESLQDPKRKPGFQLLWKIKLDNKPRQLSSLTPPATLERLIGYRGFRMLGFVGGSSDAVFTIDTDLGRMEWEKKFVTAATSQAATIACPGAMTAGVARPASAAPAAAPAFYGGGGGRGMPARSSVGE